MSLWFVFLCVLCPLCVLGGCRPSGATSRPPLVAQVSGTFETAGLSAPVRIARDRWGVPHITAQSPDDLFFAQGFVQAEDRLFQMDLWRRSALGRLSEVLGPNFMERDTMTRRMQYRGDLDAEWASYGPDTRAIAAAFVRGINAWVALARERPPEAFVLAGWKPERWSPLDLLNRTDAFTSSGDAIEEIFRARLVAALGAGRVDALLPRDRSTSVPEGLDLTTISPVVADAVRRVGTAPFFVALASTVRPQAATRSDTRLTARVLDHPSPRYLVHLTAPGWNVIGATAPWLPGVAVGHNDRISWDLTAFDADAQDICVEKVNPSNPHQVEYDGQWVDTTIVKDSVRVRGRAEPLPFVRELTRHGVIVASDRGRNLAYAVRWSGFEPGAAAELGALALDRARSWSEFRDALARWKMPAATIEYADADGHAGFQTAALIPIRRPGRGALPAPGWTGACEWSGWRTLDELPHAFDARGAIAAAPPAVSTARRIWWLVRAHPDRAEALLQKLKAAGSAAGSLQAQQALVAEAADDTAREPFATPLVFAHPLGVTPAARQLFNIGPFAPSRDAGSPFVLTSSPADWDRTRAMNAPGQSESPESPHFSDLARLWADGERVPLLFSDAAVRAAAPTTLILMPAR